MDLIKPKDITITDLDGEERVYTISRMDFISAREVITQWPVSALPKIGHYPTNNDLMLKLMGFVAVNINGTMTRLSTPTLVVNHVPDFETGAKIEAAMFDYNSSFFQKGTLSSFFADAVQKLMAKISETLTQSPESSSQPTKPHSMN